MELSSTLPLTESTLYILLSLSSGPRHGYSIIKDVEQLSQSNVSLSTGTLYGALKRLLDQGWIERVDDPEPDDSDRVRKHYALTQLGRRVLEAEVARLHSLVMVAQLRAAGKEA